MKRKLLTEAVSDFQHIDDDEFAELRRRLLRWASDSGASLAEAEPVMPGGFINRTAANWRLLLSIADKAGCGEKVRSAATSIANIAGTSSITIDLLH